MKINIPSESLNTKNEESPELIDIFRQSPYAIEVYDKNGYLKEVNSACIKLFGIKKPDKIKGFNLFTNPHLTNKIILNLKKGKNVKYELTYDFELIKRLNLFKTTRSNTTFLECYINPTFNLKNEISGYIVHISEINERKKSQLLLAEQTHQLKLLNNTKDKFMSIIAHDLKNPFNAIIGFTDLMLHSFDQLDDETMLKGLRTIESASSHAYKLLENLLIWSQNQTGRIKFNPEVLNLKTLVTETLSTLVSSAENKQVKIVVKIKKTEHIYGDKNMIDSIIRNLVSNAIKFSNKAGKVVITSVQNEKEIHISVTDRGIGITQDILPSIFEIDKRTSTLGTENEQGTGLGLILCKEFIIRHKGKIWVNSTPGHGSIFTISLPIKHH